MPKPAPLGVKILSLTLGVLGACIPVILLLLDDIRYEPGVFMTYASLFGVPGFLLPFLATRAIAWLIQSRN